MIDPLERWAQYGEKPDYAGLLTFSGRAVHRGPGGARGLRRGDRRRADGRPRLRPPGRAARAARDPLGELPAGPAPRGQDRRVRRAARARLRRRARDPGRRAALARRDRGDGRPGPRRGRAAVRARRRPLDHRAVRARVRGRSTVRSAWCTSTPTRTPAPRSSASSVSHGTFIRRLVDAGHLDAPPLRADRAARLLARRGGVRLAGRARDHEPVHARRPRPRDPRGGPARGRGGRAPARCT